MPSKCQRSARAIVDTPTSSTAVTDPNRRGILGHGSILALTSIADRTSPVLRGKWIMEVLLCSPPPPPPPNVPALDDTKDVKGGRTLSIRERMEQHRANPACASCHRMIDPIGLALENFDVTGAWRIRDNGAAIDAASALYDGTPLGGRRFRGLVLEVLSHGAHATEGPPACENQFRAGLATG